MFKTTLILLSILCFGLLSAQCYVDGSPTVYVGETQLYTVKNNTAKCPTCHSWSASDGNISIGQNLNNQSVEVVGRAAGTAMIFLTIQTAQGDARCNKNISILPAVIRENPDCDVYYSGFSEKKVKDGVVAFVHKKSDRYHYRWSAVFSDGKTETSTDAEPQFTFTKDNQLAKISVQILSEQCMRTYSKTYEDYFWSNF